MLLRSEESRQWVSAVLRFLLLRGCGWRGDDGRVRWLLGGILIGRLSWSRELAGRFLPVPTSLSRPKPRRYVN